MCLYPDYVSVLITFFFNIYSIGECHIGEPCNPLIRLCFPASNEVYCDENRICRCRPEYPVQVGIHSCAKSKKHDEYCSYNEQCDYHDNNSFCTQNTYSSYCECLDGFVYDRVIERCIPGQYNHIDKLNIYAFFIFVQVKEKGTIIYQ